MAGSELDLHAAVAHLAAIERLPGSAGEHEAAETPQSGVRWVQGAADDEVYDLVGVLAHNDDPPVSGMGSAIFLHLARRALLALAAPAAAVTAAPALATAKSDAAKAKSIRSQ